MKPKVYTSIDINEARSPLVRVVHADEWDLLMNELRYLQGERRAVVAWLRGFDTDTRSASSDIRWCIRGLANYIERGEHRREEKP